MINIECFRFFSTSDSYGEGLPCFPTRDHAERIVVFLDKNPTEEDCYVSQQGASRSRRSISSTRDPMERTFEVLDEGSHGADFRIF